MAQRQLELSCERFRKDLNAEDDRLIRATCLDDVRAAIAQTERELASRQGLRNFDRLSPYINAVERYGKVIEIFCNSDPLVPYIWAPIKFIILAVKEQTRALDQILGAYAQIGNALPRFSALQESFKNDRDFQTLFAFLYDDITEFHRQVYRLIRRPAWPIFFSSAWGRFERHFGALITNIEKTSDLIDKQATTYHILKVKEWRQKSLEDSITLETRRATEQLQAVLNWLGTEVQAQKDKLDWLNARSHEGTSTWIARNTKFRSWLQRGRGSPLLWIHGKPGSGKSVLVSQVIPFVPADPKNKVRILFFFCDYRTPAHQVTTQIFKTYLAQCISQDRDIVPFLYEEYVAKGLSPVTKVLKPALIAVSKSANMVRLIVDGLDEIEATEHKPVLRELKRLTEICGETCKLLVASQDIPSIRSLLGRTPQIFLGDERQAIESDMRVVVDARLTELDEGLNGALEGAQKESLRVSILNNAGGMFLWINLILTLLEESSSLFELESIITTLPKDLEQMYGKLLDRIRSRCDAPRLSRVSRIFEWLLFAKGKDYIQKYDVLLGSSIHEDCVVLNRKSMPFPTALDICKPLIEDGPGGSVALIHSTLPYFLLQSQNGPLISPRIAHEHIAFACISHLIQILQFVQPEVEPEKKREAVGLGCLGLQRYASENWISHILNYLTEVAGAELNPADPLIRQLLQLTATHEILLQTLTPRVHEGDEGMTPTPALHKLRAFPEARDLISRVLSFQDVFSAQQLVEGPDILAIDSDTTLFSLADSNYQSIVQSLLRATTCAGLTEIELDAFKTQFGGTAFLCPVKGCVLGFRSETELNDHKAQRHKQRLRCYEGKCIHNDVGFANKNSLHQHVKQVHKKGLPRIPTALKRKREIDGPPVPSGSITTGRHPSAEVAYPSHWDNDITDADFDVLDEHNESIGISVPHDAFESNAEMPNSSSPDLSAMNTPQKSPERGNLKTNDLPVTPVLDEPRLKRSRRTIDEDHSRESIETPPSDGITWKPSSSVVSLPQETTSNGLTDLDIENLSAQYKKAGDDWSVVFNPALHCRSDVDLIHTLAHDSMVCSVRFSMDGKFVATGCNKSAQIFEVSSGKRTRNLYHGNMKTGDDMYVRAVCFSSDGRYLATGSDDKLVRVWDIASCTTRDIFTGHELGVYSLDFSRDGRTIASGSGDRTVRLWDVKNSSIISTIRIGDVVTGVTISPDCQMVAAGSLDNCVSLWNMQGDPIGRLQDPRGHQDLVYSIAFSLDGSFLVSGSIDRTVKMWSVGSCTGRSSTYGIEVSLKVVECMRTFEGHRDHVLSVAMTSDEWVLSGSKDCGVQFWNQHTGEPVFLLQGHKGSVDSISPSPTGKYFATASADKTARIWKYDIAPSGYARDDLEI